MPRRKPRQGQGKGRTHDVPQEDRSGQEAASVGSADPTSPPAPESIPDPHRPVVPSAQLTAALDQVMAESVRRVAIAEAPAPAPARVESGWLAAALGSWLLFAILVLFRPAFARGPEDRPWQPTAQLREPSLRYGMWLARDRVEGFASAHARLPSFIGEVGVTDPDLTLRVTGERDYVIEGRLGGGTLQLQRGMDADSFLGGSLTSLRRQ